MSYLPLNQVGGLEVAEMQPGLNALRKRCLEMKAKEKVMVDRLDDYKRRLDDILEALKTNSEAFEADDELTRRKENVPLEVMIGSQVSQKNVTDLMRIWDKSGDGTVSLEEFRKGLKVQGIEIADEQVEEIFNRFDDDQSGTIMTDELKNIVRQMQDQSVPYFKALKEDGAKVADQKKRANDMLQAERDKHKAEEEEEARQAELEQASAQKSAAEHEAAAREAEAKRQQAREAAAEKKRAEKAAFEARVRQKREKKMNKGAKKADGKGASMTARSAGGLSERAGGARRRKSSPRQRGAAASREDGRFFPLRTGLEMFRQGDETERTKQKKKEDKWKQSLMEGWKEVSSNKPLIVRSEPSLESEVVGEISPGSLVQLLEGTLLHDGTRRVRTNRGWVSAVSKEGNHKMRPIVRPDFHAVWPSALYSGKEPPKPPAPPPRTTGSPLSTYRSNPGTYRSAALSARA